MRVQIKMKRIITVILAIVIVLSLGTVAFAADSSDTVAAETPATDTSATIDADHVHTFETFTDGKSHSSACTVCAFVAEETDHKLIARESYHQWECDECGKTRVYHNEETMDVNAKNEFFHIYSCADCGYEYAANHIFAESYNTEYHNKVCIECGYETECEAHVMVNDFYGDYHDIQCGGECTYIAEHHVGVKYETVDSTSCQAICRCGVVEVVEHDFYDFICDNCNYAMSGTTYATVYRISLNDDGSYRVRFMVNGETQRVDMRNVNFKQGDFVRLTHSGDEILDVTVLIDGSIIEDPENFAQYLSPEMMENFSTMENVTFEDLIMETITFHEDGVNIAFESGRVSLGVTNDYVVYDLRDDGDVYKLCEYDAVLYISTGEMTYFIVIW